MEQVTIKIFEDSFSAHMLKAHIEAEDIPCFIYDENMMSMNPLMGIALGGIKLKVWESDVEKALQIIEEINRTPLTNEEGQEILCPRCSSTEFYTRF